VAAEHPEADRLRSVEQDIELGIAGENLVPLFSLVLLDVEFSAEDHGYPGCHITVRGGEEPRPQDAGAAVDEGGIAEAAVDVVGSLDHFRGQRVSPQRCGFGI
jgi:hypothetical protein